MIILKNSRELTAMQKACRLSAQVLKLAGEMVEPGVSTGEIDRAVKKFILSHGAKPSFLGYGGFPGSACISINDQVIHGIPGGRVIQAVTSSAWMWGPSLGAFTATTPPPLPRGMSPQRPRA